MPTTERINPYGQMATEIYDFDKPIGALHDLPFYLERLAGIRGSILEPASGTGRFMIPLIEAGHEVWGFEPSPDMLAVCRRHCAARGIDPPLADMTFETFAYDRKFAAIVVPAGTFSFLPRAELAVEVLRKFHDHLEPGGLVMIDIQAPGASWLEQQGLRTWSMPNGDLLRLDSRIAETDPIHQSAVVHMVYERWRAGRLVESELEIMTGRTWGVSEFELALKAAGFTDVQVFGNYARRPPRRGDRGLTFEAIASPPP